MKKIRHQRIMTRGSIQWMIVFSMWMISRCVSMAPVNSSFESAKTLAKGQMELMANYSVYFLKSEDSTGNKVTDEVNNNFGFRLGYGISNRLDLKFRYERMLPVLREDKDQLSGINYFALSPRYGIVKNRFTGALDVGLYTYTLKANNARDQSFFISPRFDFTYPSGKIFDLTLTTKIDIFPSDDKTLWGLNLGCGISSDLEKWSFRPEIGLMKDLSDFNYSWFTGGAAFVLKFNTLRTTNPK